MPVHVRCPTCGKAVPKQNYAAHREQHRPKGMRSPWRTSTLQGRFRREVLKRANGQCQYVDHTTGIRCARTERLHAHHLIKGSWDPTDGVCLCERHHMAVDRYATPTPRRSP